MADLAAKEREIKMGGKGKIKKKRKEKKKEK